MGRDLTISRSDGRDDEIMKKRILTAEQKKRKAFTDKMWRLRNLDVLLEKSKCEEYKEKSRIASRRYYAKHKEERRLYNKTRYEAGNLRGRTSRLTQYKSGARIRGLDFALSPEAFNLMLEQNCNYCGQTAANGVDRIDSTKGYYSYNVVPCCTVCNRMKSAMSLRDFLNKINQIAAHTSSSRPLKINALTSSLCQQLTETSSS